MATVRDLDPDTVIGPQELEEIAQDVFRMVRRARATRESRLFVNQSLQQLVQEVFAESEQPIEGDLESLWEFAKEHSEAMLEAIRPFRSFFNTNGLLPDDVSSFSLLTYVLVKGVQSGAFRQN